MRCILSLNYFLLFRAFSRCLFNKKILPREEKDFMLVSPFATPAKELANNFLKTYNCLNSHTIKFTLILIIKGGEVFILLVNILHLQQDVFGRKPAGSDG